ncbi:MAG TPA: MFS transporter [Polyangiaceae bacterium]|nr:MFS transporter [Polyangiaceae bacterium]
MSQAFTSYQRRLFVFLSVACFFEGYDFFALGQLLPNLRAHFGLSPSQGAAMVGVVNAGTVLAYAMVGLADRWGRRRVLTTTILGYTLFSLFSGLAPNAVVFTLCQLVARVFLIGEWATSMVIAAEEFPAERRGMVIGVISAVTSLGSIFCAGLVPTLLRTPLGWRSVYLAGTLPLLLIAYARRGLRETARFQESRTPPPGLTGLVRTKSFRRVLVLGAVWFLCYVCSQNAIFFWKEFALAERGMSDADVGKMVVVAALSAMPFAFASGVLLDKVGRKIGTILILSLLSLGVFIGYTAHSKAALGLALALATIGANSMLSALNTLTTELVPTEQRGAAFAWANNLIGRVGYWLSPFAIGLLVEDVGWGNVLRWTAFFPLAACVLIAILLPETKGRELEETAA